MSGVPRRPVRSKRRTTRWTTFFGVDRRGPPVGLERTTGMPSPPALAKLVSLIGQENGGGGLHSTK